LSRRPDDTAVFQESIMADIAPFRALRYDFAALEGDVSARVAPPYDILDENDRSRLLAQSDRNIVAIDLPFAPAKCLGPAHLYERAGRTFQQWIADGTLVREQRPALYVYHQTFEFAGRRYTRRMFIARLKLVPFDQGDVVPHEETFGGPKEDRLALMKATHANLSPVYGLYRDAEDRIGEAFAPAIDRQPDAVATLEGVQNRVWIVTDAATVDTIVATFRGKKCYIADGHHRYNTGLNYRDWVAQQLGGELPAGHPAGFVMLVLGSMDDPGSLILPTHRVLAELGDMPLDKLVEAWKPGCEQVAAEQADVTLHHGATGREKHLRFTHRAILAKLEPHKSAAWRDLDLAYLHRYLIDELFKSARPDGGAPVIRYVKAEDAAKQTARKEHGIAILCKPATMAQLRDVGEAGDLMPHKSTYFYPKVATGLTINPLN